MFTSTGTAYASGSAAKVTQPAARENRFGHWLNGNGIP